MSTPASPLTVFVTGASSGIGEATARAFAKEGHRLLLCARRGKRLEALAKELSAEHGAAVHTFVLDVQDRAAVVKAIASIPEEWRAVDVLVNNAGLARGFDAFHEASVDDWEQMIDTNVKGLLYVSRAILPGMIKRGRGHVVNIGSIAGLEPYPKGHVYCATKAAVDFLTRGIRLDIAATPLRVTSVDPGLVETEFSLVRFDGDRNRAAIPYRGIKPLTAEDVAECVVWAVRQPAHVQINQIVLTATHQSSASVIHREA